MPEPNGSDAFSTGNPLVDAALRRLQERNDARFKDLEDAMLVQAQLEKRQSDLVKQHSELLVQHDTMLKRHSEIATREDVLLVQIQEKLNFLLNREMRREGGPETV